MKTRNISPASPSPGNRRGRRGRPVARRLAGGGRRAGGRDARGAAGPRHFVDLGRDIGAGDRSTCATNKLSPRRARRSASAACCGPSSHQGQGHDRPASLPSAGRGRAALAASGEAATPPSMRLPLDTMTVSSGYGLRADPLDKPWGRRWPWGRCPIRQSRFRRRMLRSVGRVRKAGGAAAGTGKARPPPREAFTGQPGFGGFSIFASRPRGAELQRLVAERDAKPAAPLRHGLPMRRPTRRQRRSRPPSRARATHYAAVVHA